jgi:POT family proton-dependent oligopeptide transporter
MSGTNPMGPEQEGRRPRQPRGLWVLFITEMWERFSYYGMRALLVLYLVASNRETVLTGEAHANPGFGWSNDAAYLLYGIYTWGVYFTPIFGGWLADRFLGTHRSMLIGGWIIAAGHITLALTESFGITAGQAVTLQTAPGALLCFLSGLFLIVIGTGFFKPCVSVMVGQLYGENDPRRDAGFTIFYMGINVGAFLAPLVAGSLGELVGWHWGFGAAAVGMLAGLACYQWLRPRYLGDIGLPPERGQGAAGAAAPDEAEAFPETWEGDSRDPSPASETRPLVGQRKASDRARDAHEQTRPLTSVDYQRIAVILILAFLGNIFFWTAFEQAGSSMNVFAKESTDRSLGGGWAELSSWLGSDAGNGFPASWYQSVNPLAIVLFGPLFALLWVRLGRDGMDPSTPMKFALGLFLLGASFVFMVLGAMEARSGRLAGPHWLLLTYTVYTWGELCLSPVGLSMVTKLAPQRLQSLMMGLWFFSYSLSNLLAGLVARFSTMVESGQVTFFIPGLPGFYLMLVVFPAAAGLLITLLAPLLRRMMHGVH